MAEAEQKPNDEFREARHRTSSPTYPGESLSRQELAELVNSWIYEHRSEIKEADANYIGQLERGKIRWPNKFYREAFLVILGASTDSELGFVNARSRRAAAKLKNVKRKKFIQTTLGAGVGALALEGAIAAAIAELLEDSEPPPVPTRVGATEIEHIRAAARMFSSWDFTYGSGMARDAVMASLRYSAKLLGVTCPAELRPELYSAVGELAEIAAFMAFDAGAHHKARRVFRFALACAGKAKDWPLRAEVLSCMTVLEISTGQPDEGLTLAEEALVRADDRLTATGRAMLHTGRARALAKMHRVQETLRAIGTADEHFAHSTPANDPPYLAYYNAAHQTQLTGQALADLALLGHPPEQATARLTAAAAEHTDSHARSRVVCLTKLASLTMVTGDPLQAVTIGHQALDAAGGISSRRTADDLRELNQRATAHQKFEEVAHLRRRISMLLVCTDSANPPPITPLTNT